MNIKQAIEILQQNKPTSDSRRCGKELCEACDVAISAMQEQQEIVSKNTDYVKAIKWMKNIINDAQVCLDEMEQDTKKNPNTHYNTLLYDGRKQKAKIIILALLKLAYYEQLGTLDEVRGSMQELQLYKDGKLCLVPEDVYARQCEELDAYKQLGILEEVREAVEKQDPKKVEIWNGQAMRPNCRSLFGNMSDIRKLIAWDMPHCKFCGQAIDWSEEE